MGWYREAKSNRSDYFFAFSVVSLSSIFRLVTNRQATTSRAATTSDTAARTIPPGGPPDAAMPSPSSAVKMQQGMPTAMIARRML